MITKSVQYITLIMATMKWRDFMAVVFLIHLITGILSARCQRCLHAPQLVSLSPEQIVETQLDFCRWIPATDRFISHLNAVFDDVSCAPS